MGCQERRQTSSPEFLAHVVCAVLATTGLCSTQALQDQAEGCPDNCQPSPATALWSQGEGRRARGELLPALLCSHPTGQNRRRGPTYLEGARAWDEHKGCL